MANWLKTLQIDPKTLQTALKTLQTGLKTLQIGLKTFKTVRKYFHLEASFSCVDYLHKRSLVFAKLSSSGRCHVGLLFDNEEQKMMARNVSDTFATGVGRGRDVFDTDR